MVACVDTIVHQHFTPQNQVAVSMPGTQRTVTQRTLSPTSVQYEDFEIVNLVLKNINLKTRYPVLISESKYTETLPDTAGLFYDDFYPKLHNYVIFLWPEDTDNNILVSLKQQLDTLRANQYSRNRYRQHMLIVMNCTSEFPQSLAMDVLEFLWQTKRIVSVLILVQSSHKLENPTLDLYTWFPYGPGRCGLMNDVILLDQWSDGKFTNNACLFPKKIPNDLMGCPIKVSTKHYPPFVIMAEDRSDKDDGTMYTFRGLEIEYLHLITAAMNMTVKFLPPTQSSLEILIELEEGRTDVVIGAFPMRFYQVIDGDPTKAYVYTSVQCYIPCPRPLQRTDGLTQVFMPSVWLAVVTIFILTAVLLCITAKTTRNIKSVDSAFFRALSRCIYSAWAVFLGVSAPVMPTNYRLRILFLTFIWYCFAINIVFQAFFTSFLIQPGYEKRIETMEELREAGIQVFVFDQSMKEFATDKEKANCRDDECLVTLIEKHSIALKTSKHHMQYVASGTGITEYDDKYVCSLYDVQSTLMYGMYLQKGSPLLDRFNVFIQRCLEGGLGEKYWSDLNWSVLLQSKVKFMASATADNDMYFVFKLSHLKVAFSALLLGCACSFTVFLAEVVFHCIQHH
jgi:hypothetical protein